MHLDAEARRGKRETKHETVELKLRSCLQMHLQDHAILCKMSNNILWMVQLIAGDDSDLIPITWVDPKIATCYVCHG